MKKIVLLIVTLFCFGLSNQNVSGQEIKVKSEKTSVNKTKKMVETLKLDESTEKTFTNILNKHYAYLEKYKDSEKIESLKAKISANTYKQMKAILTKEQYSMFEKFKL